MKKIHVMSPELLKAAVYGANDGIVTTFAVVAGVAGAGLATNIVLILGVANMLADGLSMGLGDFLGERAEQKLRKQRGLSYDLNGIWKTGLMTFIAFVLAGSLPLVPYVLQALGVALPIEYQFLSSIVATAAALFLVGALRAVFTKEHWLITGLEILGIGAIAAVTAYGIGAWIKQFSSTPL